MHLVPQFVAHSSIRRALVVAVALRVLGGASAAGSTRTS